MSMMQKGVDNTAAAANQAMDDMKSFENDDKHDLG